MIGADISLFPSSSPAAWLEGGPDSCACFRSWFFYCSLTSSKKAGLHVALFRCQLSWGSLASPSPYGAGRASALVAVPGVGVGALHLRGPEAQLLAESWWARYESGRGFCHTEL